MNYYYFTKKDKTLSLTTDGPSKYDPDALIEYEGDLDLSYSWTLDSENKPVQGSAAPSAANEE